MEFRILGPLEITHGDEVIKVSGPRQQTVMAMLLLEANHVIPVERLIRAIWDEEPPGTARAQVQICISILRRQIMAAERKQLIDTRLPGYLLKLDDDVLDSHVFEAHVAAGRGALAAGEPHRAATEFRCALALWRGTALSGVNSRLVQQSVSQLNERRLTITEECLECELSLGMHHDVVGEVAGLVEEHPLRERLRALLMTALYEAGRQAEALEAYRHTRDALMDELGVEPGKELRQLHHAILNGSPVPRLAQLSAAAIRPPAAPSRDRLPVPRLLPAAIPDFTSEDKLVDVLAAKVMGAGSAGDVQAVPVTVIVGRGGAGKTTLAVQVAHQLAGRFPDGQLFARLRNGEHQTNPAHVLERFLRALGISGEVLPEGTEERAEMYRSVLGKRRMLIVLDDAMSEQQVSVLLPGSSQCSVIVTSRKRLTGLSAASRVEVHRFTRRSALELLTSTVGAARVQTEPDAVTALCELCGYLPLALRIVAARLAARPHWSVADLVERLVDESRRLDELNHGEMGVRASISLTYEILSPDARRLFRRLALIEAPSFAIWVGSPLLQIDALYAQDLMEELTEAYLIDTEAGPTMNLARYRFHDLVRPFARERLAAEESADERHKALEHLVGALLYLAGEAHRREYSGDFLLPRSGASRWMLPDTLVNPLLENPLAWYEDERLSIVSAVRQSAASGLLEHSWDLALSTVALFEAHAYYNDWRETHETALKAACRAGDRWGEAAMRYSLGSLYMFEQQPKQAARQLTQSLALYQKLGGRHGVALTLRNLAYLDRVNGDLEVALARWEEALGIFQVVGDSIAEAHVMQNMAQVHLDFGEDVAASVLLDRARRICEDLGNRRVGAQVLHRLGALHLQRGEAGLAAEAFRQVLMVVRESDDRVGQCYALLGIARAHLERDELQAARQVLVDADNLAASIGERMVHSQVALARAETALKLRDLEGAADHAERAIRNFEELRARLYSAEAHFVRGQIYLAAGQPQAALDRWKSSSALLSALNLSRTLCLSVELRRHMSAVANAGVAGATVPAQQWSTEVSSGHRDRSSASRRG
jgi:DNA-binding SARP family transcriptional activator/tetratricopeptide (TPR) repeat protein